MPCPLPPPTSSARPRVADTSIGSQGISLPGSTENIVSGRVELVRALSADVLGLRHTLKLSANAAATMPLGATRKRGTHLADRHTLGGVPSFRGFRDGGVGPQCEGPGAQRASPFPSRPQLTTDPLYVCPPPSDGSRRCVGGDVSLRAGASLLTALPFLSSLRPHVHTFLQAGTLMPWHQGARAALPTPSVPLAHPSSLLRLQRRRPTCGRRCASPPARVSCSPPSSATSSSARRGSCGRWPATGPPLPDLASSGDSTRRLGRSSRTRTRCTRFRAMDPSEAELDAAVRACAACTAARPSVSRPNRGWAANAVRRSPTCTTDGRMGQKRRWRRWRGWKIASQTCGNATQR